MDQYETTKLLALIKVAYPNSYRGMDDDSVMATVNMWHRSFRSVPYQIMEQAFDSLRMVLKFPPTVAEMAEQLRKLHFEANEIAGIHRTLGDRKKEAMYLAVADATAGFKDWPNTSNFGQCIVPMIGGNRYAGTSGDRLDRADRISFLAPGE